MKVNENSENWQCAYFKIILHNRSHANAYNLPKYPFFGDCSRPSFASICCHVYFVADAVDFVVGDKAEDGDGSCHCKFEKNINKYISFWQYFQCWNKHLKYWFLFMSNRYHYSQKLLNLLKNCEAFWSSKSANIWFKSKIVTLVQSKWMWWICTELFRDWKGKVCNKNTIFTLSFMKR